MPLICIASWSLAMIFNGDTNRQCWEGYTDQPFLLIISVPMIMALTANLLFLINIVRIVATKAQRGGNNTAHAENSATTNAERAHFKKAVRATVILFPLLGVTNLLFFINPKNGTHDKLYMLFNATMQSSQGVFLAVLYCFLNSEVQDTMRRYWRRYVARSELHRSTTTAQRAASANFHRSGGKRATLTVTSSSSCAASSAVSASSSRSNATTLTTLATVEMSSSSPPPKPPRLAATTVELKQY